MVQKALEIDFNNGAAHITLAKYYCSEKNLQLAAIQLEKARTLGAQPDPQLVNKMNKACP